MRGTKFWGSLPTVTIQPGIITRPSHAKGPLWATLPDVATSSMFVFSWRDMNPRTLKTANPAKKLVPQFMQPTRIESLKKKKERRLVTLRSKVNWLTPSQQDKISAKARRFYCQGGTLRPLKLVGYTYKFMNYVNFKTTIATFYLLQ